MIKIISLTITYQGSEMADAVDIELENEAIAKEFMKYFYRGEPNKLPGEHFNNHYYGGNVANLSLHFGYTNRGVRANHIIKVLQQYPQFFALPEDITIAYIPTDAPERFNEKYLQTIKLSLEHVDFTVFGQDEFLRKAHEVNNLKKAAVSEKFSSLIHSDVKVSMVSPGVQVTCQSIDAARQLRKKIFELANTNMLDTSFSFKGIPGVAGTEHPSFIIKANKGHDLFKLLEKMFFEQARTLTSSLITRVPSSSDSSSSDEDREAICYV